MMFLFHRQWYHVLWVGLFCFVTGVALSAESYPDMVATRIWRPLSPDAHAVALFPLDGRADEEVTGVSMEEMLELSGQKGTSETGLSASGSGTSGDVCNTAGMGRAAELKGACKLVTAGRFRGGLQFEGKDGQLVTRGYDSHPARTVEMWLRPTDLPDGEATVFCLHDTKSGNTPVSLRLLSQGGLQLVWGRKKMEPIKSVVPAGEWTHISVGWETRWPHKREVFLRVNGRTEQNLTSMNVRPALRADALVVGAGPSGKRGFAGTMDEIRFSRTLRDYYLPDHLWTKHRAEVAEPSGQPFFRDEDDLLLWLGMDSTLSASVFPDRFHAPEYEPEPGKADLPPWDSRRIFKPGVHGEALTVGKEGMNPRFSGRDFLRTKAGTLAFWLRPLDWDNFTRDNRFDDARPRSFCLFTVFGEYAKGSWERKFKKSGPIMSFRMLMNMSERVVDPVDLHPGRWVHVACTWEGAKLQYYVNGRRRSPDGAFAVHLEMRTAEDKMKTDPKWWIRAKPESLRFDWTIYQGRAPVQTLIDDFRIYRRPLAPSEIGNLARLYDPREEIAELPSADIDFDYNGVVGRVDAKVVPLLAGYEPP
ncbi:MAG: LamG domain-containing protein, partial [Planctomycetes bacterium]|nr:LamG domain-containing protein [Planctomycetota bacterium]